MMFVELAELSPIWKSLIPSFGMQLEYQEQLEVTLCLLMTHTVFSLQSSVGIHCLNM